MVVLLTGISGSVGRVGEITDRVEGRSVLTGDVQPAPGNT